MKKHALHGEKRDVKKTKGKHLRRDGRIPATVYGKKMQSESVSVKSSDFSNIYADARETGLVELTIDGTALPVLIHHVQKDPVNDDVLHVEFLQVDLKEKVKTEVPVVLVGEAPAVTQKLGVMLTLLSQVEVEALPADLPEKLTLDVSSLAAVDQELKVSDLAAPKGVTILTDSSVGVVKIAALVSREAQEQAAQEAAAAAAAAPVEGEAATQEGESTPAPAEAGKAEPPKEEPPKAQ